MARLVAHRKAWHFQVLQKTAISGALVYGPMIASSPFMITEDDYLQIAETLIRRHGANALHWADLAIDDLDTKGEQDSADHWRSLRDVIGNLVASDPIDVQLALN